MTKSGAPAPETVTLPWATIKRPRLKVPADWVTLPLAVSGSEGDQLPAPVRLRLRNGEPPERITFAAAPFIVTVPVPAEKTPPWTSQLPPAVTVLAPAARVPELIDTSPAAARFATSVTEPIDVAGLLVAARAAISAADSPRR